MAKILIGMKCSKLGTNDQILIIHVELLYSCNTIFKRATGCFFSFCLCYYIMTVKP